MMRVCTFLQRSAAVNNWPLFLGMWGWWSLCSAVITLKLDVLQTFLPCSGLEKMPKYWVFPWVLRFPLSCKFFLPEHSCQEPKIKPGLVAWPGGDFCLSQTDDRCRSAVFLHIIGTDHESRQGAVTWVVDGKYVPVESKDFVKKISFMGYSCLITLGWMAIHLSVIDVSQSTVVTFSGKSLNAVSSSLMGLKMYPLPFTSITTTRVPLGSA